MFLSLCTVYIIDADIFAAITIFVVDNNLLKRITFYITLSETVKIFVKYLYVMTFGNHESLMRENIPCIYGDVCNRSSI